MNPLVFLIVILFFVGIAVFIAYRVKKQKETPPPTSDDIGDSTPTTDDNGDSTPTPPDGNKDDVCNGYGTPIFDEDGNFVRCDCKNDTTGIRCEFTPNSKCHGNGKPNVDSSGNFVDCSCYQDKGDFAGKYCCDYNDDTYKNINKCTDTASCTESRNNSGWNIQKKTCDQVNYGSEECTQLCRNGNPLSSMRCVSNQNGEAIVTCEKETPFNRDSSSVSYDVFLNSLYYPPDQSPQEKNTTRDSNLKYWKPLSTDRDLSGILNTNGKDAQGKVGSFFKVFTFPDQQTNTQFNLDGITNGDLKSAIDSSFTGLETFSFDNYGNISIKINNQIKTFLNPAFPHSNEETVLTTLPSGLSYIQTDPQICTRNGFLWDSVNNICINTDNCSKAGYYPSSDKKCYKYRLNLQNNPLRSSSSLKLYNKNFITSSNKKWILVNDKGVYSLLYNPIHSTNYKNHFSVQPQNNRLDDFLIHKYGEISAEKGTYGLKNRNYGDYSANCFSGFRSGEANDIQLPDCIGDTLDISPGYYNPFNVKTQYDRTTYNRYKGSCACATAGKSCDTNMLPDSFLSSYTNDLRKFVFGQSANNSGACPSNIQFINCSTAINAGQSLNIEGTDLKSLCGGGGA